MLESKFIGHLVVPIRCYYWSSTDQILIQVNKVDIVVNVGLNKVCEKMQSFSVTRKKTPFQKHREEEEAKKKVGTILYFELK